MVYYRDMAEDPYCYGLKPLIANLMWIHENLAFGTTVPRYGDKAVACYERLGYPGLLCAGNWDTWNRRTITVKTNFGPHVELHDYTGHAPNVWTDRNGNATITIPSNAFSRGQSYVAYSRTGYGQPFSLTQRETHQTFFGAPDLDLSPARANSTTIVGRVWCAKGTDLQASFANKVVDLFVEVTDPKGLRLPLDSRFKVGSDGWHELSILSTNLADQDYELQVEYTGTTSL